MKRTIIIDGAIVTLSAGGMMIHNLDNLAEPVATLPFPECDNGGIIAPGS